MRSVILITLLAVAAAGLGVSTLGATTKTRPAPRLVVTERDSGHTLKLKRTRSAVLRLGHRWIWTRPRVRGRALVLEPVDYESDPGFEEWKIRRRGAGTATITAYGRPNCTGCARRARSFRVKLKLAR